MCQIKLKNTKTKHCDLNYMSEKWNMIRICMCTNAVANSVCYSCTYDMIFITTLKSNIKYIQPQGQHPPPPSETF